MAISSSPDWSLASTTNPYRRRSLTFMPSSQFPSFSSLSNPIPNLRFFHVRFSASPTPILEEEAPPNDSATIQFDVKLAKQYTKPENLNEFVCGLFEDPQTEELGYEYYQRLKERPDFRPEGTTLEHVIRYLLKTKKWGSVLSLLEDFKIYRVFPDKTTCSRMITNCIRSRKFKIAEALLDVLQSEEESGKGSVLVFVSAMRGYNRLHMYRSTVSVFERMKRTKLVVVSRCYLHAMEAYMRIGDCDKVVQLFQELETRTGKSLNSGSYFSQIYAILCQSLGQSGRAFEALKYFRDLNEKGIVNDSIYSSLICSFASLREVDMAEGLLREAQSKTMLKDPELYFKVVLMYVEEGLLERTLEVVQEMKNSGDADAIF